jgi:hypothetical protein
MAIQLFSAAAQSFNDTPTEQGLETQVDALFAPLLSDTIEGVQFSANDPSRTRGDDLRIIVTYSTGGIVITHPYKIKGFTAISVGDLATQVGNFITANPTFFFAPVYYQQLQSERRTLQYVGLLVYNESLSDGSANWAGGGNPPVGVAGGDLQGTYPNPQVKQSSVAFAFDGIITPTPLAATTNNYNPPGLSGANTILLSATAPEILTGIAGGALGRILIIHNTGGPTITFQNASGGSSAGNQFAFPNGDIALLQNAVIELQYDATAAVWRTVGDIGSSSPGGVAGGDLTGTYPNPKVKQSSTAFALNAIIGPFTLASDTNNWTPSGLSTSNGIFVNSSAAINITGLAGGAAGRIMLLTNNGTFDITLLSENAGSTAANRFELSGDVTLAPNQSVILQYDFSISRWRVVVGGSGGGNGQTSIALANGANTVSSVPIASIGDVIWSYTLVKGSVRYNETMRATQDGTNPYNVAYDTVLTPGTVDVVMSVTLSGGNLNLIATTSSTGWTIRFRFAELSA